MLESKTKVIDGANYKVTMLKASKGFALTKKVSKLVLEPLSQLAASGGLDAELGSNGLKEAASLIAERYDSPDMDYILSELRGVTMVDPEGGENFQPIAGIYELHFAGKMLQLHKWLLFALEVQLGDFLDFARGNGLQGLIPSTASKPESKSPKS